MNTPDIELPAEFRSGNDIPVTQATIKRERMEEILRDAIEADRQQRGEPVAWLYIGPSGDISAAYETVPNLDLYALAKSEGGKIKPVYEAPQPAQGREDAERLDVLIELCGHVENGTDAVVKICQDDATREWIVRAGADAHVECFHGRSVRAALDAARARQEQERQVQEES